MQDEQRHHLSKGIIYARHIITGEKITLNNIKELADRGFNHGAVYQVLAGKRMHHHKWFFSRTIID